MNKHLQKNYIELQSWLRGPVRRCSEEVLQEIMDNGDLHRLTEKIDREDLADRDVPVMEGSDERVMTFLIENSLEELDSCITPTNK